MKKASSSYLVRVSGLVLILSMLVSCSLPQLPWAAAPTPAGSASGSKNAPSVAATVETAHPQPVAQGHLPPAVVETQPLVGGELAPQGPLVLAFNQPMDQASVES